MTTHTIIFTLPEEKEELRDAMKGIDYHLALCEIHNKIFRPSWKHGYDDDNLDSEEAEIVIEKLHEIFCQILEDYEVEI